MDLLAQFPHKEPLFTAVLGRGKAFLEILKTSNQLPDGWVWKFGVAQASPRQPWSGRDRGVSLTRWPAPSDYGRWDEQKHLVNGELLNTRQNFNSAFN